MPKLKLYVWTEFCPDWRGGLAFAIANSEAEAKAMVIDEYGMEPYCWGNLMVYTTTKHIAFAVSGGS